MNNLKKLLALALVATMAFSMTACGSEEVTEDNTTSQESTSEAGETASDAGEELPEFVTISSKNGEGEFVDMVVPVNPSKVAFMDYVSLDMCATLGILDDIEYMAVQDALAPYLAEILPSDIVNLGGLKTYQEDTTIMTTIMDFEPDLIFTSGRSAGDYEEFMKLVSEDGGVVSSSLTYVPSSYDSFKEINERNAKIFGAEDEVSEIIASYDDRLEALKAWGEGQSAAMTIFTGGAMNVLGNESRCSMIFNDLGFENVGTDVDTSHGDTASYEALLLKNPDYIFVLDRDSAIGAEGATSALELLDNEIIQQTDAWKNGNIVVLDPIVWYMVEGGLTAMDTMLADLEVGMNLNN